MRILTICPKCNVAYKDEACPKCQRKDDKPEGSDRKKD